MTNSNQLVKAQLYSVDDQKYDITFLYNPTQLDFARSVRLNAPNAARDQRGQNKVSFGAPEPCVLTISRILFDTYEEGTDVFKKYLLPLVKAVKFMDGEGNGNPATTSSTSQAPARSSGGQAAQNKRPPLYYFIWGSQNYLRCFVESFRYQITLFLPDGTPVRAMATLTLKEVDKSVSSPDTRTPKNPNRNDDTREKRFGGA